MKKKTKGFETIDEYEEAKFSSLQLNEWVRSVATDSQRRAWNFASTAPRSRSNVPLSRTWGVTEIKSFTLTKNTRDWLEHLPRQTTSKTVEVALCRYRVWPLMLEYIQTMTTECRNAKRRVKELEAELKEWI